MRIAQAIARQPLGVTIGFVGASALFLLAFGLAFASGRVLATHNSSGNVHACVNLYTGQARIMLPGRPANCTTSEMLVEWAGGGVVAALEARVAGLEAQVPDCLSTQGTNAVFSGCDVQILNGAGSTASTNGTGNLIIGYNEADGDELRNGSHNLVVGVNHGYSSFGGFVAGSNNVLSGEYASVSGGFANIASENAASVSGGTGNIASGPSSSISGGSSNVASGIDSSVGGGTLNHASGFAASVGGGAGRTALGTDDWVAGTLFQDN